MLAALLLGAYASLHGCGQQVARETGSNPALPISCDQVGPDMAVAPGPPTDMLVVLKAALQSELARLNVSTHRSAAQVPTGADNSVFDLQAQVLDPDGEGPEPPSAIELTWTECLVGDYDQNGEVGISDITPLGQLLGHSVAYDDPALHNGLAHWPCGSPGDGGDAAPHSPAVPGSPAANWRLARIDGDANGELNIADVTPIALHWGERTDGYRVYHLAPGEEVPTPIPNPDKSATTTTQRDSTYSEGRNAPEPTRPVRYRFLDKWVGEGEHAYYVVPVLYDGETEGPPSHHWCGWLSDPSNRPPSAAFTAIPLEGDAPLTVDFDANDCADADGEITRYDWDFDGDGECDLSEADAISAHVYSKAGIYTATLRVVDDVGLEDTTSVEIIVSNPDNWPPIARLEAEPVCGMTPLIVNFDASGSQDPDGEITRFEFDFGEGDGWENNSGSSTSQHEYVSANIFEVRLRVVDNQSAAATDTVTIVAYDQPPTPPHVVNVHPTSGEAETEITLVVTVTGMPPYNYSWTFGGGATPDATEEESPTVTLGNVGNYSASVTVSNPGGQDTHLFDLDVRPAGPPVRFEVVTVPPVGWPAVDFIRILPGDPIVRRDDRVGFDMENGSVDPLDPAAYNDVLKINGSEFTLSIADWEIYPRITVVEGSDPSVIGPETTGITSAILVSEDPGMLILDISSLTPAGCPGDPIRTYAYRLFDVDDSIVAQDAFQIAPTDLTPPPPEGHGWGINVWDREEREIGDHTFTNHTVDGSTCGTETADVLWVEFSNGWMFDSQGLLGLNVRLVLTDTDSGVSQPLAVDLRGGETRAVGSGYICTHGIAGSDFRRPELPDWPGILEPGHTYDVGLDDPLTSGVDFTFDVPLTVTGSNPWD